jgi:hypothetical protein
MARDIVDRLTEKQVNHKTKRKLSGSEKFWLIFRLVSCCYAYLCNGC